MDDKIFLSKLQNMCDKMESCDTCPLGKMKREGKLQSCVIIDNKYIDEYVNTVSEYTSRITRQSLFLDMYPAATIKDGVLDLCPNAIDSSYQCTRAHCSYCKKEYWLHQIL